MGSFGERLRREREMRGVTLEEIAAATKIGTRNLKALEDEQFKILPGGIFNRGFVRAYARFLGISEDQAIADYVAASGEREESEIDAAQLLAQREEIEARSKAARKEAKKLGKLDPDDSGIPWAGLAGLVIVIALAWGGRAGYVRYQVHKQAQALAQAQREAQQREAETKAQQQVATAQAAQPAVTEPPKPQPDTVGQGQANQSPATSQMTASTVVKSEPKAAPPTQGVATQTPEQKPATTTQKGNFTVSLRARQRVWVSVTADGKHVMSGEIAALDQRDFQAHDHLTIKTGNAGGTDLALNGKPLPSLGAESEVRTVTINANGTVQ